MRVAEHRAPDSAAAPGRDGGAPGHDGAAAAEADAAFRTAAARFHAARDSLARLRGDIVFEDCPAPRRLVPYAAAMGAVACRDGSETGTGRLMLLHDPAGQPGWEGTFRLVAYVRADIEEEIAADPLLGEVGWSWLTDALDLHVPGCTAPSGTVTRSITEGFGAKAGEPASTGFELRASWSPPQDADPGASVAAWCDVLAAAAGLPAQPPGTTALRPRPRPGQAGKRAR
jgi:hypothetical protein